MSTVNYEFAQSGTTAIESTGSGMSGTTFWVYENTTVSNIKVAASQKDVNQDSFVRMVLTTSDGITTEETKQIYGERSDCSFNSTLSVNQNTWFNISFFTTNSYLYCDGVPVTKFISTGWTGNTSTPANRELYSCKFTITYDPLWTVDAQNDGYVRIATYDTVEFNEFKKDADGYPTNNAAWKLDEQNDGYPWVTGFPLIRREVLMKFINDTGLNYLVQKFNNFFKKNVNNTINHGKFVVDNIYSDKIDLKDSNGNRIIEVSNKHLNNGSIVHTKDDWTLKLGQITRQNTAIAPFTINKNGDITITSTHSKDANITYNSAQRTILFNDINVKLDNVSTLYFREQAVTNSPAYINYNTVAICNAKHRYIYGSTTETDYNSNRLSIEADYLHTFASNYYAADSLNSMMISANDTLNVYTHKMSTHLNYEQNHYTGNSLMYSILNNNNYEEKFFNIQMFANSNVSKYSMDIPISNSQHTAIDHTKRFLWYSYGNSTVDNFQGLKIGYELKDDCAEIYINDTFIKLNTNYQDVYMNLYGDNDDGEVYINCKNQQIYMRENQEGNYLGGIFLQCKNNRKAYYTKTNTAATANDEIATIGDVNVNTQSSKTIEGDLIHIEDAAPINVEECITTLEPIQDLHGYSKPWVGGSEKNLLPMTEGSQTINDVTFTVNDDGTINAQGTATDAVYFYMFNGTPLASNSYILTVGEITVTNGTGGIYASTENTQAGTRLVNHITSGSVNISDTIGCVWVYLQSGATISGTIKPMIRLSSVADATFEPYSNICPINGHTGVELTRTGKNLLPTLSDYTHEVSGVTIEIQNSEITLSGTATNTVLYDIPLSVPFVAKDGEYLHLCNSTINTSVSFSFGGNGVNAFTKATNTLDAIGPVITENIGLTCTYLRIYVANGANANVTVKPMIVKGNIATSYKPYTPDTHTITFPQAQSPVYGCKVDWIQGVLRVTKVNVILNGSETGWTSVGGDYPQAYRFDNMNIIDGALPVPVGTPNLISNKYPFMNVSFGDFGIRFANNDKRVLYVYDAKFQNNLAGFLESLQTEPLQVVYTLATPIEIPLTPEVITLLKGENNVYTNSGTNTLTYQPNNVIGELKGEIQLLQSQINTLINQLNSLS